MVKFKTVFLKDEMVLFSFFEKLLFLIQSIIMHISLCEGLEQATEVARKAR